MSFISHISPLLPVRMLSFSSCADSCVQIRAYIEDTVGYVKLDCIVLAAVAEGCMEHVLSQMEEQGRRDEAASMIYGLAAMLFDAQVGVISRSNRSGCSVFDAPREWIRIMCPSLT